MSCSQAVTLRPRFVSNSHASVFAGTYTLPYWQGGAWNVIVPNLQSMDAKRRPRLDSYRHMNALVEKYDWTSLPNSKDLSVYFVPKENINIGVRLPKEMKGDRMTGTWFDPLAGTFGEPIEQEITQWPSFDKPAGDQFAILIVQVQSNDQAAWNLKVEFGKVSRKSVIFDEIQSQ